MIDVDGLGGDARDAVDRARAAAHELGSGAVGTEHLLLGVIAGSSDAARALTAAGATVAATRAKVAETAAGGTRPGVDADLELSSRASRAIGRAHRFSHTERSEEVAARHVLLGVLDVEGTAGQVLRGIGVDVAALRQSLLVPSDEPPRAQDVVVDAVAARCDGCGAAVDEVTFATVPATSTDGRTGEVVVFSCRACGVVLGVAPSRRSGSTSA